MTKMFDMLSYSQIDGPTAVIPTPLAVRHEPKLNVKLFCPGNLSSSECVVPLTRFCWLISRTH